MEKKAVLLRDATGKQVTAAIADGMTKVENERLKERVAELEKQVNDLEGWIAFLDSCRYRENGRKLAEIKARVERRSIWRKFLEFIGITWEVVYDG